MTKKLGCDHLDGPYRKLLERIADLEATNKLLAQQGDKDFHERVRAEKEIERYREALTKLQENCIAKHHPSQCGRCERNDFIKKALNQSMREGR